MSDEDYQRGLKDGRAENEGVHKRHTQNLRKIQRVSEEIANLIGRNGTLRYEVKRLEGVLAWIYRTEQPIEEIRGVIERTIPKKLKRGDDGET